MYMFAHVILLACKPHECVMAGCKCANGSDLLWSDQPDVKPWMRTSMFWIYVQCASVPIQHAKGYSNREKTVYLLSTSRVASHISYCELYDENIERNPLLSLSSSFLSFVAPYVGLVYVSMLVQSVQVLLRVPQHDCMKKRLLIPTISSSLRSVLVLYCITQETRKLQSANKNTAFV